MVVFVYCSSFAYTENISTQEDVKTTETVKKNINSETYAFYDDFFATAGFQSFMAVSKLKDFTKPKPGWRMQAGYSFLHGTEHSIPVYLEFGHSVISGTNQLVRSFDIFPITLQVTYEYTPIKWYSIGAFTGFGLFVSHIDHYPTAIDMVTDKLQRTKATDGIFIAGLTTGANIMDLSTEIRASFGLELILEKPQVIPLPSFQLGIRIFPSRIYKYAKKRNQTVIITEEKPKEIIKEVVKEVIVEKLPEPKKQFESIYVYFEPEKAKLDLNAVAQIKKAVKILQDNEDVFVMFEGSAAPFGSQDGRIKLESKRVKHIAEYLTETAKIPGNRILYIEPKGNLADTSKHINKNDYYTQYRFVRIRFVRIEFNPNPEKNVYSTEEISNEK